MSCRSANTEAEFHQKQVQPLPAQKSQVERWIGILRSLDDRTLSQIGLERHEIERFAHAEAARSS